MRRGAVVVVADGFASLAIALCPPICPRCRIGSFLLLFAVILDYPAFLKSGLGQSGVGIMQADKDSRDAFEQTGIGLERPDDLPIARAGAAWRPGLLNWTRLALLRSS